MYLKDLRPKLATLESGEALFLNINGQRINVKKLTQIYAQVTMNDLSRVYKETHPAAKSNINNL